RLSRDWSQTCALPIYHDVTIGKRVVIQSGAVIGGEGFGFANQKGVWQKIAQIGGVTIGDDVEIGANTTVDRSALADTLIGNGVKIGRASCRTRVQMSL